jgi:uncharacterized secreted protein with C-terminal beta-propeller domain
MPRLQSRAKGVGALGALATSLLAAAPAAADTKPATPAPVAQMALTTSPACDGVRDLMIDTVVYQMVMGYGYGYYGYNYGWGGVPEAAALDSTSAAPMAKTSAAGVAGGGGYARSEPSHYTGTNVQERGVDEGDLVKTDGKFIYTLRNNELVIAKTWPVTKTSVASRLTFKTMQPQQLYLRGDKLVIQGYATDYASTRVMLVDVSDRGAPRVTRSYTVDGWNLSSRIVGDDVYLVQNGALTTPQKVMDVAQKTMARLPRADQQSLRPWEVQAKMASSLRRVLAATLTQADVEASLPKVKTGGKTHAMACSALYVPASNPQLGLTSVARLSLDGDDVDLVGATLSGGQVYASTDAIYVTAPSYTYNAQGGADYSTQIHQFGITDGAPTYVASGRVAGTLLNQFSMSEWNGDLRVATTSWNWDGQQQQSNSLFVLRPRGRQLAVIGSIRGIAKNEQIYSGRMFGDKGYLVTFRQTDPLFTLDLKDPTKPRIVGELKVNGFSSYIHPIDNDRLLTIGQDADDNGRVTGLHLQVFDVSNPAKPTREHHEKLATTSTYTWSAAQHDHHAFTYDPVSGTLAVPLSEYAGNTYWNGMIVYDVDADDGFTLRGKIDHRALAAPALEQACADARKANNGTETYACNKDNLVAQQAAYAIDRSIVVDKYVLTTSQLGLEIHAIAKLDEDGRAKPAATLAWAAVEKTSPLIAQ